MTRLVAGLALATLLVAGCGSAAEERSSVSGGSLDSSAPTSGPVPTEVVRTDAADDTRPPNSPTMVGRAFGTAVAIADDHVVIVNLDGTGDEVVSDYFAGGGAFPARPQLHPDGLQVFFAVGFEDGWYDCATAQGEVYGVATQVGAVPYLIGKGHSPRVSPDGRFLFYLRGSTCLELEDFTRLVPTDSVVILDLVTGEKRVLRLPIAASQNSPVIDDVAWDWSGAIVYVVDGVIYRALPEDNRLEFDSPVTRVDVPPDAWLQLVGVGPDGLAVVVVTTAEPSVESVVYDVDLASGMLLAERGRYSDWVIVEFDASFTDVIISDTSAIHIDGLRLIADSQSSKPMGGYLSGADF
jgi:hypothetical protein